MCVYVCQYSMCVWGGDGGTARPTNLHIRKKTQRKHNNNEQTFMSETCNATAALQSSSTAKKGWTGCRGVGACVVVRQDVSLVILICLYTYMK